jgi:hypothetical protein
MLQIFLAGYRPGPNKGPTISPNFLLRGARLLWFLIESGNGCSKQFCNPVYPDCSVFYLLVYDLFNFTMGYAVAKLVEALCYKPEGRGFESR